MVAAILSRAVIVLAGILYPAYSSFKAVRARSHREYTQWMMYWIVFALFQAVEVLTDTFIPWVPLYYELKILFVLWLVLPITQGSKQMYRMVIHPFLVRHETEIDDTINRFGEKGMKAIQRVSRQGINLAANTVVTSAIKGQAVITETLLHTQQEEEAAGAEGVDGGEGGRRHPSSSSSTSTFSNGFEVIEEQLEPEIYEDPPSHHSPSPHPPTSTDESPHLLPDSDGLYHRT